MGEPQDLTIPVAHRDPIEKAAYLLACLARGATSADPFDLAQSVLVVDAILDAVYANARRTASNPDPLNANTIARCVMLKKDIAIERDRSKRWQKLAGHYDAIRDWLRLCDDTPDGHAEFYRQCCRIIFGDEPDDDQTGE